MIFLRIVGVIVGLSGMALVLTGIVSGSATVQDVPVSYGVFAILAGLLLAMAADAGQKMMQRQKAQKAKKNEKPKSG